MKTSGPISRTLFRLLSTTLALLLVIASCNPETREQKTQGNQPGGLLDSLFQAAISNQEIPAAGALVIHEGREVFYKGFGMKDIESGIALRKDDIFRIASMTKIITSLAIMQLYERGLIMLDDPVSMYLEEFKDPTVLIEVMPDSGFTSRPASREITIHHLLTHTSGLGYGFQSEIYNRMIIKNGITEGFEERPILLRENVRKLADLPLLHDPGEKYTYGLSIDVLGAVIEVVAGEPLDEYFQHHIFNPLGMDDTHFYLPEEKSSRLVTVYEYNPAGKGFIPTTYPYTQYPVRGARRYLSGGGDLSSTLHDIGIFAQMMLNKGEYNGIRIVGSRYAEMMTTKQTAHGWWDNDIGFGVSIATEEGAAVRPISAGSYGWGGFFDTYCWVDPEKDLIAILFLQMYPTNSFRIHEKFQQITYRVIEEK